MALICQVVVFKRENGRRWLTYQRKPCACQSFATSMILNGRAKVIKPVQHLCLHGNSIPALRLTQRQGPKYTPRAQLHCKLGVSFYPLEIHYLKIQARTEKEQITHS